MHAGRVEEEAKGMLEVVWRESLEARAERILKENLQET
jgi:hypothetical protein